MSKKGEFWHILPETVERRTTKEVHFTWYIFTKKDTSGKVVGRMKYLVGEARYQKRMSLRRLAKQARISKSYLQRIEAGEVRPSLEIMVRLARGLEVPLEQLYQEE